MVTFVCDVCGDTIKKNKVDKHCATKCRDAWNFTCLECGKVFAGYEYDQHTSWITEVEKYQGHFIEKQKEKKRKQKEEEKKKDSEEEQKGDTEPEQPAAEEPKPEEHKEVEKTEEKKPKGILKNKEEKSSSKTRSKRQKVDEETVKQNIENQNITDINITSNEWIKQNLLGEEAQFLGWKKTIKVLIKSLDGKSALKKKFKKAMRKAYEMSGSYNKETRKQLNEIIDKKLEESTKVKVFADLVQNTQSRHEEKE